MGGCALLSSLRLMANLLRPHAGRYLLGILWLLGTDAAQLSIPWLLGHFTDRLKAGDLDRTGLLLYVGAIVALAVFTAVFRFLWRMFVFGTSRVIEYEVRDRLFRHLQGLSANYFNRTKTGDLMAHATNDIQAIRGAAGPGVLMFADGSILSIATLVLMFSLVDWRLAALGLLPLPLLAVAAQVLGRLIHDRFQAVQASFSGLTDRVQENYSGIRVVKAFVQEEAEKASFTRANRDYMEKNMRMIRVQALLDPIISLLAALGFVIVLGYGGLLVLDGRVFLGEFVAFNAYLGMLTWPMLAFGWVVNMMQRGAASLERINTILAEEPEIAEPVHPAPVEALKGAIEFRNLTFRYRPDLPAVLEEIDLEVRPGETVAIVGRTGSGKTTLSNLLLRLYDPPRGQLFLDGVDILDIPLRVLRRDIGYMPQDNFLFSKTIRENISFAPEAPEDMESVRRAADLAQVTEDVEGFPQGFETILGERGITLSGGQKQRVGIARAVLENPAILILDDCLSAVDTETEARILEGLRRYMADRTTLLISHRISTVQHADQIIVLDQGRIVERGTHEELLGHHGEYYDLWRKQQLEARIAATE